MGTLVKFYFLLLLRRSPILIAIVILFTGFALGFAINLPDRYASSAKLLVEPPQIPDELAASTVQTAVAEQLGIIQQRLTTRANLIDIANKFDVFANHEKADELTPDSVVSAMRQSLNVRTTVRRSQANFIDIAFEADDPRVAAAVVNELVTRALDDNVRMRTERAGDTLDFFEQEVDRLSNELARQSSVISKYKSDNSDSLPEALNFRLSREAALDERLGNLRREQQALLEQRERVIAVYEETGQLRRPDAELSPEERQLRELESELTSALAVYSENNPRVIVLKTRIDQLKKVVDGQTQDGETVDTSSSIYAVTLAEIDARSKSLSQQEASISAELLELREFIDKTPQTAIGLDSLERDYRNIQSQYNAAVQGLARAKTGEQIELNAKGERITIVESAVAPSSPTSPNRKVITAAGGFAGVGLAAALFVLLELLNSAIRRPEELVRRVGITPLATIPYISTRRQRIWRRLGQVTVVVMLFVVLPGALFLIDQYVISLGEVVQTVRDLI